MSLIPLLTNLIADDFDLKGSAPWAPFRDPKLDYSAWGTWDVFEACKEQQLDNGCVGALPNGDWIAWDSFSGMQIGFPSRDKAEMLAVLRNEGRRTRVVFAIGTFCESSVDYAALKPLVEAQMAAMAGGSA